MSNTLVQSSDDFYIVDMDGNSSAVAIPSTVTATATTKPRMDVSGVHAVVVNSVDSPIIVDDNGIALFLSPPAPTAAPTITSPTAGALTGTYSVKYTFAIRTIDDTIVAESGFSPAVSTGAIAAKKITASNLQLLTGLTAANYDTRYEVVRRLYRTTNGTSTYFLWTTVADNTTTTVTDDTSDAAIGSIAADFLATAPFLSNVASFRDRLFGVNDSENREVLLYSETSQRWAWPTDNFFTMPQVKGDSQSGITALMPAHDALGIAKSNMLLQLTGSSDSDFQLVTLSTSTGAVNQEVCCQYRDNWYFLGADGVYRWGNDGITCITDNKVRSWFTTDTYFNRSAFSDAFATFDQVRKTYKLFLAPADSDDVTSWVEFDTDTGTWWGPHTTTAYTFTSAFQLANDTPLIGEGTDDGFITVDTDTRSDDATIPIEVEAITVPMKSTDPPATSYWGFLRVELEPQAEGVLGIYPIVGEPDSPEQARLTRDMTRGSQSLSRLGYGRYLTLRFYHNVIAEVVQILGFEVDPVNLVGRRG